MTRASAEGNTPARNRTFWLAILDISRRKVSPGYMAYVRVALDGGVSVKSGAPNVGAVS
jgi:hypothetical protein